MDLFFTPTMHFFHKAEFVITVFQQAICVHKIKLFLIYASMPSMLTEAAFSRVGLSVTISNVVLRLFEKKTVV